MVTKHLTARQTSDLGLGMPPEPAVSHRGQLSCRTLRRTELTESVAVLLVRAGGACVRSQAALTGSFTRGSPQLAKIGTPDVE